MIPARFRKNYILLALIIISSLSYSQSISELNKFVSSDPDSAIVLFSSKSPLIEHLTPGEVYRLLGNAYFYKSVYDSAISNYLRSNAQLDSTNLGDRKSIAKNYNNVGVCYNFMMHLDRSYEYHRKALNIREELNDPSVTSSYNNLGLIMFDLKNFEEALVYFNKAYEQKIAFGQYHKLSTTIRNIVRVYTEKAKYDSAVYFLEMNLKHLDTIPSKRELASTYTSLGHNLLSLGDNRKSIDYTRLAFRLKKELGDIRSLLNAGLNLSIAYQRIGEIDSSDLYLDSLYLYSEEIKGFPLLWKIEKSRASNAALRNDHELAFELLNEAYILKDSADSIVQNSKLIELEEKYQSEQKEAEINKLQAESEIKDLQAARESIIRQMLIFLALAVIIIAALIYSRYLNKSKLSKLLKEKNSELAKINQTKDRLFSIISHDLKSPLSSFHLITQSLTDNFDLIDKSQLKEYLVTLRDSSANVRDMLDNLLKWALAQTDQLNHKLEEMEVNPVINKVTSQLKVISDAKSIVINTQLDETYKIIGDQAFLEIAIRNLLSNALKFTEMGRSINLSVVEYDEQVEILITDEGVGMMQEDIDKLLDGSITGQEINNSTEKGTGLGITLTKALVEKMDGNITARSCVGKGTTFKLAFKRAA